MTTSQRGLFAGALLLAAIVAAACGPEHQIAENDVESVPDSASVSQPTRPSPRLDQVQRVFTQDDAERPYIRSTLDAIRVEHFGGEERIRGQLERFGDYDRYLLITTFAAPTQQDPHAEVVRLITFARISEDVSQPYDTKVHDYPNRFVPMDIADFDEDGLADFVYCAYLRPAPSEGEAHIVGYRGGSWYVPVVTDGVLPACGVMPEP